MQCLHMSSMTAQQRFLGMECSELSARREFLGTLERCQKNQPKRLRQMKERSLQVTALKDLLDRPLDLETVESRDWAMRVAGVTVLRLRPSLADTLRSLKCYGSSPESVLDLLCFLDESSDEKMHKMDLEDVTVTMEQVAAARSALREAIGDVELAVKKGGSCQVASWLCWWPRLGSKDLLSRLQAMDARAGILMTRLEDEAEKENDACLQEVAELNWHFVFDPQMIKIWIHRWNEESNPCDFLRVVSDNNLRGKLEHEAK